MRIFLFLALNFAIVITISTIVHLLGLQHHIGMDTTHLLAFCFIWGMGGAFISLALSRQMAKWTMGVKLTNDPRIVNVVRKLTERAYLPMPEVGIYNSPEVNAFATGPTKNKALVAVSSGLLNKMSEEEIEGVLGHEIAHIKNGDMVTMTLLQGVVNAFVMFLARLLAYAISGSGREKENHSRGSYYLFTYVFEILFMILGSIIVATYSRFREFRADAGGAQLAGKPKMVAALEKLKTIHQPEDSSALAAFKISHTSKSGWRTLFATHPPIEERIHRLKSTF